MNLNKHALWVGIFRAEYQHRSKPILIADGFWTPPHPPVLSGAPIPNEVLLFFDTHCTDAGDFQIPLEDATYIVKIMRGRSLSATRLM